MKEKNAVLYINLKGLDNITEQGIEQINQVLRKYNMVDKSVIFCGRISLLKKFQAKGLHTGLLTTAATDKSVKQQLEECIKAKIETFIVFYPARVNQTLVTRSHENGIEIGAYKVKTKKQATRLVKLGVEFMFSDYTLFK